MSLSTRLPRFGIATRPAWARNHPRLLAYFPLDEGSASRGTAADHSGYGAAWHGLFNAGTTAGNNWNGRYIAPAAQTAGLNSGVTYRGAAGGGAGVSFGSLAPYTPPPFLERVGQPVGQTGGPMTFAVWYRPASLVAGYTTLMGTGIGGGNGYASMLVKSTGKLAIYGGNAGATQWNYDGTGLFTLRVGEWWFVCSTWNIGGWTGYVNGQFDGAVLTPTAYATVVQAAQLFGIGYDPDFAGREVVGELRDAQVYGAVLSAAEIYNLYQSYFMAQPMRASMRRRVHSVSLTTTRRRPSVFVAT